MGAVEFEHNDKVRNKDHHHDEIMTYCCVYPDIPEYAIVIRGDGRLSTMKIQDLEKSDG